MVLASIFILSFLDNKKNTCGYARMRGVGILLASLLGLAIAAYCEINSKDRKAERGIEANDGRQTGYDSLHRRLQARIADEDIPKSNCQVVGPYYPESSFNRQRNCFRYTPRCKSPRSEE